MKKIKENIKSLKNLKITCKTMRSISQHKYVNYLKQCNVINKFINFININLSESKKMYESKEIFESKEKSNCILLFSYIINNKIINIINNNIDKKIFFICTKNICDTLSKYKNINIISIDIRKMRSFNTQNYESLILNKIYQSIDKLSIDIYTTTTKLNNLKFESDLLNAESNEKIIDLTKLYICSCFNNLLYNIYSKEYINNKNSIEKIDEMIKQNKFKFLKLLSKNNNLRIISNN